MQDTTIDCISKQLVIAELVVLPSLEETLKAIGKLKGNKATSVDDIPPETWINGGPELYTRLNCASCLLLGSRCSLIFEYEERPYIHASTRLYFQASQAIVQGPQHQPTSSIRGPQTVSESSTFGSMGFHNITIFLALVFTMVKSFLHSNNVLFRENERNIFFFN